MGEVYDAPRVYNGQWEKPFVDGSHVCGTAADFAGFSVKNEDLPEVVYNEADLPMCCVPPFIGQGGAVASGTAEVEVVSGLAQHYQCVNILNGTRVLAIVTPGFPAWTWQISGSVYYQLFGPGVLSPDWELIAANGGFVNLSAPASWDGFGSQVFTSYPTPFMTATVTFID